MLINKNRKVFIISLLFAENDLNSAQLVAVVGFIKINKQCIISDSSRIGYIILSIIYQNRKSAFIKLRLVKAESVFCNY